MKNLFLNKRTYIGTDGEEYINMCIPSINMDKLVVNSYITLTEDHNGRIDKVVYSNISKDLDNGIDITMYYNHIFNPFAVQEGDGIYVPLVNGDVYEKKSEPELPDGEVLSKTQVGKKSMTYAQTVEYLAKNGFGIK